MIENNFDIVIVGAGVSGLVLADEITKRTNKSVLLIEKNKQIKFKKNLCFWNAPLNVLTTSADNQWNKICVIINGKKTIFNNGEIKYLHINSKNLFNFFVKRLKKRKNFKFLMGQNILSLDIKKRFCKH